MIEELKLDNQKVTNSLPTNEELEAILTLRASPDEIIDMYYRFDPLNAFENSRFAQLFEEQYALSIINRVEWMNDLTDDATVAENAGITLLASVVAPELLKDASASSWSRALIHNQPDISKDTTGLGIEEVVPYLYSKLLHKPELSKDDLVRLSISVDYMNAALSRYHAFSSTANNPNVQVDESIKNLFLSKIANYSKATNRIADLVSKEALSIKYSDNEEILDIGMKMGLFSTFGMASSGLQYSDRIEYVRDAMELALPLYLKSSVQIIRDRYFNLPSEQRKVIKGDSKGPLHESLWLLDINFILIQNWCTMPYAHSIPALPRTDMPKIGYPNLKRGFDQTIILRKNPSTFSDRMIPVQLKSSSTNNHGPEYHPGISLVTEDNFQDVDLRRLDAKLKAYEQWLEHGTQQDEYTDRVMRYTLKSSRDFIETVKSVYDMTDSEYFIWKYCVGEKVDRHRRRRIERKLAKMTLQRQNLLI